MKPTHRPRVVQAPGGQAGTDAMAPVRRHRRGAVAGVVGAVVAVQAVLVVLFGWPAARATPHDLPIAVAGPPSVIGPLVGGLTAARPGAFSITHVRDTASARAAVTGRDVYAAITVDPSGVTMFTASAASPTVAQLLTQAIPTAIRSHAPTIPVQVHDLAPNPAGDPHGAVPASTLIPVTITSLVAGALLALLAGSALAIVTGLLAVALLGALTTTLVVQSWLGALSGSYLTNAAVLALVIIAIAATTAALARHLRAPGIALTAVTIFFFGFPFSGATSAPELLPQPWGNLGQGLPAGAASTALRSVAFFDGAGAAHPLLILTLWTIAALTLLALPTRTRAQHPQPVE